MTKSVLISVFAITALLGCSSSPEKPASCMAEEAFALEPHVVEGLRLSLPMDTHLVAQNTTDAQYWTWNTAVGLLSVTWVSGIARDVYEEERPLCVVAARDLTFRVFRKNDEMIAVSDAALPNEAGLLVELDNGDMRSLHSMVAILRTIEIER